MSPAASHATSESSAYNVLPNNGGAESNGYYNFDDEKNVIDAVPTYNKNKKNNVESEEMESEVQ